GKYLAQFLLRRDGSENFPKNKRWGIFPGVSVGWRISEESFFKDNLSFIDNLKLKASYGEQGNDRISAFQYLMLYQYGRSQVFYENNNKTSYNGIYPSVFPNPEVTWEVAKTTNIGLEGTFRGGKLGLEAEVFRTRRSNILITRNASVPAYTGLTSLPAENIGIVDNKGFELQLSSAGKYDDLIYNITGNFTFARNTVVYMDETPYGEGYDYLNAEGHPMGSRLLYQVIGINKTADYLKGYPQMAGAGPGDFVFEDVDGDGKITSYDRRREDLSTIPEIVFGATFDAQWKNFDFMMLLQGQARVKYYISPRIDPQEGNIMQVVADGRWSPATPDNNKPGIGGTINNAGVYPATYWHRDASFLRLKNLEIGYTLPPLAFLSNGKLRIYVGGYNLLTFDTLKIVDPESNATEGAYYPQLRIYNAGIKLTF
ncbi:MAG: SusC/RagA family TonB-linked outer membrane protein, partial [Tannerellaceae bacterium]|nr:SusC/RagA family TonB-linked outer membrane protein [Tannerellaceae bacterium]